MEIGKNKGRKVVFYTQNKDLILVMNANESMQI